MSIVSMAKEFNDTLSDMRKLGISESQITKFKECAIRLGQITIHHQNVVLDWMWRKWLGSCDIPETIKKAEEEFTLIQVALRKR